MDAQFVQVGERRVFVRHAGRGPALVLLHQSPQSGAALRPLIERFAATHAVFAPDTPGFGFSDPLPRAQPTIPDLADALAALLDALGLQRVLLYGVHTGASIAARLAQDRPGRVAGLVCDGLALFNATERQPLLDGYLPPFEPQWDGSHLTWLWARLREQTLFFPWHTGLQAARLAYPLAGVDKLQADVLDLLQAGDGYRAGYRAPLLYEDSQAGAARLAVPARLLYRRTDVLRPHLDRLPALPPCVQALEVDDAEALAEQMASFIAAAAGSAPSVDAAGQVAGAASSTRGRAATRHGALAWHAWAGESAPLAAPGSGATLLQLPDIGSPAANCTPPPGPGRTLALDWPGHGASEAFPETALAPEPLADAVMDALHTLAPGPVALHATGGAAALAAVLASRLGPRCTCCTLVDPLPLDAAEAATFMAGLPDLHPQANGAHLLAAWSWARLRHLFWPWMSPHAGAAIARAAPPPRQVHAEVVEMLRAGPQFAALWHATLQADLPALLRGVAAPVHVQAGAQDERQRLAARLTRRLAPRARP